jgi:hypothetical protein
MASHFIGSPGFKGILRWARAFLGGTPYDIALLFGGTAPGIYHMLSECGD